MSKKNIFFLLLLTIIGTALITVFTIHYANASKPQKIVQVSVDPKEDLKVGELVLKEVHKEIHITSYTYDHSFPIDEGTLDDDAGAWQTFKHFVGGKSIRAEGYIHYEMKSNLLDVQKKDILYDESSQTVTMYLEEPTLHVWLDTEKTKPETYKGLFSDGYSDDEYMRFLLHIEKAGEALVQEDENLLEKSKEDIKKGLSSLLETIPPVKKAVIHFR